MKSLHELINTQLRSLVLRCQAPVAVSCWNEKANKPLERVEIPAESGTLKGFPKLDITGKPVSINGDSKWLSAGYSYLTSITPGVADGSWIVEGPSTARTSFSVKRVGKVVYVYGASTGNVQINQEWMYVGNMPTNCYPNSNVFFRGYYDNPDGGFYSMCVEIDTSGHVFVASPHSYLANWRFGGSFVVA